MEPKGAAYGDFTPFTTYPTLSHWLTPNAGQVARLPIQPAGESEAQQ